MSDEPLDEASPLTTADLVKALEPFLEELAEMQRDFADDLPADDELMGGVSIKHWRDLARIASALSAHVLAPREVVIDLCDAADDVGVAFFDSDDLPPQIWEMQRATLEARAMLAAAEGSDG